MPHLPVGAVQSAAAVPSCCGEPCLDVTRDSDRDRGMWRFRCEACGFVAVAALAPPRAPGAAAPAAPPGAGPTQATPGSEDKILVLIARAEAGVALFHPLDNLTKERVPHSQTGGNSLSGCDGPRRGPSRGVSFNVRNQAYEVRVYVGGVRVYVGLYAELADAERAAEMARAGDVAGARALARRVAQ